MNRVGQHCSAVEVAPTAMLADGSLSDTDPTVLTCSNSSPVASPTCTPHGGAAAASRVAMLAPRPSSEVDEAHAFKNLPFVSKLDRVKGLPNPTECQRASDMFLKTQWLLERGGGIEIATGKPIANTIAESWTMARYLLREKLEELGLHHFDAWAKLFADTVVTLEQTVTGAYRPTARFSRFKNVPEWLQLFQLPADIRMGSELPELERRKPRLVGGDAQGKRIYRTATATPELLQFME